MKKKKQITLPTLLQAEKDAIKAQEDEKKRVDALMRFTRKLYMGLEPTIKNLVAIEDEVIDALYCWMFGGVDDIDSPICGKQRNPYHEDIQWFYPFQRFLDRLSKKRLKSKVIGRIMRNFSATLCMIGQDHKSMCGSVWYHDLSQCCRRKKNPSIDAFIYEFGIAVDDFEDLAERCAPEGSYLSNEWEKMAGELRRKGGIPSQATTEPPAVEPAKPTSKAAAPKDAAKNVAKDAEWRQLLAEMVADARNPIIRADVYVKWAEVKRGIGTRQTAEMKRENFNDVLNFVNKYRNPGDPIKWTWTAAEKWARRHPDTIKKFLDNPNL